MSKQLESYSHIDSKRKNIPTEQLQNFVADETKKSVATEYQRRNPDLDPQLIWRGKYDGGDILNIPSRPLYIQEKIHPKSIIENIRKTNQDTVEEPSLFDDIFGISNDADRMDFYQHEQNWTNRMILGDSLQVMSSLIGREGLRNKVQCVYFDPPYGIKFNSNFQWSTTTNIVKDGDGAHMTREPEMVKAFRDTWQNGVHSYLSYIRDRLILAKELLSESGSIFIQIGNQNEHRLRVLLDEIFGDENHISTITFRTKIPLGSKFLSNTTDTILWYAKNKECTKFNRLFFPRDVGPDSIMKDICSPSGEVLDKNQKKNINKNNLPEGYSYFRGLDLVSTGRTESCVFDAEFNGKIFKASSRKSWKTTKEGFERLKKAGRITAGINSLRYIFKHDDYPVQEFSNTWTDTQGASDKVYVVQTSTKVIERCILMASDPGDLILDPTCGSGTTAFVSEQWGRRWITIDTSRVAIALARARLMAAQFPYYIKKDSESGHSVLFSKFREKICNKPSNNLSYGFIYNRVPHITLKSIANNTEIDVIDEKYRGQITALLAKINSLSEKKYNEWNVPHEPVQNNEILKGLINSWWVIKTKRQAEINQSISLNSEYENLFDKPFVDRNIVRVTGPFTVESLSPHRILSVNADGKSIDPRNKENNADSQDFAPMIIDNRRSNGIQQSDKSGKLDFTSIEEFPGDYLCAEGRYLEGDQERRAGIVIGPEFGTLTKADIIAAAREAVDCGFSLLVACAFHFDAQSSDVTKLGRLPIMKVMMNTDLMMGDALKGKGNLFVAFGEPDIVLETTEDDQIRVRVRGIDVFFPNTGEVRSDNEDGIACWFVDTDYDQESFFVRQAYFLGAKNPYEALKKTLKADIDEEVWETLHSNVSRAFPKPKSGYVAVKVINHLGDEAMKVLRV